MTVRAIVETYLAAIKGEGKSHYAMKCQLKTVLEELGDLPAADLTATRLEEYRRNRVRRSTRRKDTGEQDAQLKPLAPATVNRELGYLRAAFRRAQRFGLLDRVPYFPMSREGAPREGHCSPEQLATILDHLRHRETHADYSDVADLVEFLYLTGWRRNEGVFLTWPEVDLGAGVIALPPERSKNRTGRLIPARGRLAALLVRRSALRLVDCAFVFHRLGGRPVRYFRHVWERATAAAGIPKFVLHGLRCTFATDQRRAGVPFDVTMRLAGWKTDSMRRRYATVLAPELEEAQAVMESYRGG